MGALELIQDTLKGAELNGVRVLQHMKSQLEEMSKLVCQLCANDFVQISNDFCSNFPSDSATAAGGGIKFPKFTFTDSESFEQTVFPLLLALVLSNSLQPAIASFQDSILKTVKQIVKQVCPFPFFYFLFRVLL